MKALNKLDTPYYENEFVSTSWNLQSCRMESPYSASAGASARGGLGCG